MIQRMAQTVPYVASCLMARRQAIAGTVRKNVPIVLTQSMI